MRLYLTGFALALALIGCAQKGAEPKNTSQKYNDQELIDSSSKAPKDAKQALPAVAEDTVSLFSGNEIFVSKEKNSSGKYDLRTIIDQVELKGTSDKNKGSGSLEGVKADKSKVKLTVSDDLNTVTLETFDSSGIKASSKVTVKHGSITEETLKANKLDSKKLTRSNETILEYSQMTDADNATKAVETLKNGIKLEGNLVGGKTTLKLTEGTVTLTREIEKDGKVKVYLNDTASGSTKKTATWQETTSTLTISADSKKTKDLVFLTDGTITVQNYDSAGTTLEGKPAEIKNLSELKGALK
ncbi:outer surface lipoprotein OspB (plasmid) [Borreliella bissettiae]|nr:outer surface lipoprotein OspB [Borreliella bissettiae]WNY60654.1 outer surface lipoprotein OspB [Borreliella bissettiae]